MSQKPEELSMWGDASLVSQPLMAYIQRSTSGSCGYWFALLRSLNKSWYKMATQYIDTVSCMNGDLEHLASGLAGPLSHVKSLYLKNLDEFCLSIDDESGFLGASEQEDHLLANVLMSAQNVGRLSIDFDASPGDISGVAPLCSLTDLHLTNAEDTNILALCPNLTTLTIRNCRLERGDLAKLRVLRSLDIRVSSNMNCFAGFLTDDVPGDGPENFALLSKLQLHLSSQCTNEERSELVTVVKTLNKLRVLDITTSAGFGFNDTQKEEFLKSLPQSLEELNFGTSFAWNDSSLAHLGHLHKLKSLSLGLRTTHLQYSAFEWVKHLRNVENLILVGDSVYDHSFAWLRKLPRLKCLNLTLKYIGPTAFSQLSWVSSLRLITIDGLENLEDLFTEHIVRSAYKRILDRGTTFLPVYDCS